MNNSFPATQQVLIVVTILSKFSRNSDNKIAGTSTVVVVSMEVRQRNIVRKLLLSKLSESGQYRWNSYWRISVCPEKCLWLKQKDTRSARLSKEEAKAVYVQWSALPRLSRFEMHSLDVSTSGSTVTHFSFREIQISHPLRTLQLRQEERDFKLN